MWLVKQDLVLMLEWIYDDDDDDDDDDNLDLLLCPYHDEDYIHEHGSRPMIWNWEWNDKVVLVVVVDVDDLVVVVVVLSLNSLEWVEWTVSINNVAVVVMKQTSRSFLPLFDWKGICRWLEDQSGWVFCVLLHTGQ
jgi:hypothetical protein